MIDRVASQLLYLTPSIVSSLSLSLSHHTHTHTHTHTTLSQRHYRGALLPVSGKTAAGAQLSILVRNLLIPPLRLRVVRMQSPCRKSALFPYFGGGGGGGDSGRHRGRSGHAGGDGVVVVACRRTATVRGSSAALPPPSVGPCRSARTVTSVGIT